MRLMCCVLTTGVVLMQASCDDGVHQGYGRWDDDWPRPTQDMTVSDGEMASDVEHADLGLSDDAAPGSDGAAPGDGCTAAPEGGMLCLVCRQGGKEVFRQCLPPSQTCKAVSQPGQVCIVCFDGDGNVVSKYCVSASQTCKAESVEGKLCLVCRDPAGQVVSTVCEPAS